MLKSKENQKWLQKDLQYIWHPYTQMKDCQEVPPILIEKAKGLKLYDIKGNYYYDTISSWWCNVHGHNRSAINKAIKKQLTDFEHVLFAGFTHKPAILLAERLLALVPSNLTKVFFSDNGSTSVEVAMKMSFQYWQNIGAKKKTKFISLDNGYHGDTIGTMSLGGVGLFNKVFAPLFFSSYKIPAPYCYRCPAGKNKESCDIDCLWPLEKLLLKKSEEIAAIALEPLLLAAGGMIIYPKEYLIRLGKLAKRYNIHLILDEVATGFGRTGEMFAADIAGVRPDFMCLSKGLTAGYLPMGLTLTTQKIYQAFYGDYEKLKTFYHGHTYTANPLSCAAALASLDIFEKEKTLIRVKKLIPMFKQRLTEFSRLPLVGDTRTLGLIGALELVKDKKTKEGFSLKERVGLEIYKRGLDSNLLLRPLGNVIYLFLPLCVTEKELDEILDRTYEIIQDLAIT